MKRAFLIVVFLVAGLGVFAQNRISEEVKDHKLIVYQLLPRYFTNTNTTNKYYGSKEENGVVSLMISTKKRFRNLKN